MKLRLLLASSLVFLASCGSDTTNIGSGVDATNTALSKLNLVGALMPNVATRQAGPNATPFKSRGAFSTTWDTIGALSMGHPKYDGTGACSAYNVNVNLKDWMGYQFDENAERCNTSSINIFGRVKQSLGIFCAISYAIGASATSAAIPAQSKVITFDAATKAAMKSSCGLTVGGADGTTMTLEISHPTGGTYDTKFVIPDMSSRDPQDVYMSYTGTSFKIASNEANSNGRQRVLVDLDTSANSLRAEYISRNTSGGIYIHRLFYDGAADSARVMSQESGTGAEYRRYVVSGKPSSTTAVDVGLSFDLTGNISNPTFTGDYDREACINKNTGSISTDAPTVTSGAFSCGTVNTKTVDVSTAFGTIVTAVGAATTTWNVLTSSTTMAWSTIDDMLTTTL